MNGTELNTIISRLDIIETKQEERHSQNVATMSVIFDKLKGLDVLKCGIHEERMVGIQSRLNWLYLFVTVVLIGGVALGIWAKIAMAQ